MRTVNFHLGGGIQRIIQAYVILHVRNVWAISMVKRTPERCCNGAFGERNNLSITPTT